MYNKWNDFNQLQNIFSRHKEFHDLFQRTGMKIGINYFDVFLPFKTYQNKYISAKRLTTFYDEKEIIERLINNNIVIEKNVNTTDSFK